MPARTLHTSVRWGMRRVDKKTEIVWESESVQVCVRMTMCIWWEREFGCGEWETGGRREGGEIAETVGISRGGLNELEVIRQGRGKDARV